MQIRAQISPLPRFSLQLSREHAGVLPSLFIFDFGMRLSLFSTLSTASSTRNQLYVLWWQLIRITVKFGSHYYSYSMHSWNIQWKFQKCAFYKVIT